MTTEASIIAQLPTYLGWASDGTRTLNKEGLRAWVTEQMNAAIGTTSPYYKSQVASVISPLLDALASTISPAHWATSSGWPLGGTYSQVELNTSRATAVASALSAMKAAARRVTSDYLSVISKTETVIETVFDAGIAPYIPIPVTRLPDSRFYVTTMVTSWGEESAPSPVSIMLEPDQNDTVTIPRPAELSVALTVSKYLYTGWRIYRSNTGSTDTAFQLVGAGCTGWDVSNGYFPNAIASVTDSLKGSELQEVMPTTTWLTPPTQTMPAGITVSTPYLRGLTGMANGVMAGFFDNTVCFCEPYVPYAWPVEYQLTTKHPIVGMGSFGQTLFVGTKGIPYLISGSDSASMSAQELPGNQSCVSARSIASTETGVLYASPDGICLADYSGVKVVTQGLFTRDDWTAINPSSIVGVMHHGVYYFLYNNRSTTGAPVPGLGSDPSATAAAFKIFYEGLKQLISEGNELMAKAIYNEKQAYYGFTDSQFAPYSGFTAVQIGEWKSNLLISTPTPNGTWSNRVTRADGCYSLDFATGKLTEVDIKGTAFFVDVSTDTLYMLDGTDIKALFTDLTQHRSGEYWTGVIKLGNQTPMAWLQVDGIFTGPATIKWYGDGVLRHTASVSTNAPVRLPAGRYLEHQVMVESTDRITMVTLASTTQELQSV